MSVTGGSFLSNWWFSIGEYVPLLPGLWRGGRPWECWGSPFVRLHGYFNFASQESVLSISSPPGPLLWFLYWVLSLTAFISLQNKPVICCRIKTARAARLGAYSACVCMLGGRLGGSSSDFICILHFYLFLVQTFNKSFHSGLSYGTLEVHATISGSFEDRWPGPATGVSCPLLLSQYCSVLSSEPDHGSPFLPLFSSSLAAAICLISSCLLFVYVSSCKKSTSANILHYQDSCLHKAQTILHQNFF